MNQHKTIIIVHPFTSDKVLYSTIKQRGFKIITLITPLDSNWINHCKKTIDEFSDHTISVSGEINLDIPILQNLLYKNSMHVVGIINAFDYSLEYADALTNNFLGLDLNLKYSHIRCNKSLVNKALEQANVRHIKSVSIDNKNTFTDSIDKIKQLKFPLIIKPSSLSAARSNVMLAHDFENLTKKIAMIQNSKNIFNNEVITDIVIQEFIEGEEFFVNSVSLKDKHYTSGVFKYKKSPEKFFGLWSLSSFESEWIQKLIQYNTECLNALDVRYGITHNEFIIDKEGNPYLIEINNRLAGIEVPYIGRKCYSSDEVSIFLDLVENNPVNEFNLQSIHAYSCIPYFSNFDNPHATKLDLDNITSQHSMIVFRAGTVDQLDENSNNLFVKVSAALWLVNQNKQILDDEVELLFTREKNNTLFI